MNLCTSPRRAAILLAKASITGAAQREMEQLAQRAQTALGERFAIVVYAFSEQGSPSLLEALELAAAQADDITIVPLLLPMEPGFRSWIGTAPCSRYAGALSPLISGKLTPDPQHGGPSP